MARRTLTRAAIKRRIERFMPEGVPKYLRIYDNGGKTHDRYTVLFTGRYRHLTGGEFWCFGLSENPYHPQGVCLHNSYNVQVDTVDPKTQQVGRWPPAIGRSCHLGRRIPFEDLPEPCKRLVLEDYSQLWGLRLQSVIANARTGDKETTVAASAPLRKRRRSLLRKRKEVVV